MKNLFTAFTLFTLFLGSCKTQKSENTSDSTSVQQQPNKAEATAVVLKKDARKIGPEKSPEQSKIEEAIEKISANAADPVVGYYVGMFGKNKINIAIAEIKDDAAIGYTVCAGNYRPITGTAKLNAGRYQMDMNEPGTDQYDGHFEFIIDSKKTTITGTWTPFKKGVESGKKYELKKMPYHYQPGLGTYPEASSRILTTDDVQNLLVEELEFMRNEIYARHGYSFKDIEDRRQFDSVDWYIPMGIDIRGKLTDIEVQNIDLIYEYEAHYDENYDSYGR
jgi:YARHG domain